MANYQTLLRGGHQIEIAKEPEFFTAILSNTEQVAAVQQMQEIQQVKQVFRSIYKLKTRPEDRDGIMGDLRAAMNTQAVFHHAYNPIGDISTRYYLTDTIIVQFQRTTKAASIESIMMKHGLMLLKKYQNLNNTYLFQVTSSAGKNPVKVTIDLAELPEIISAEPNLINRFDNAHTPTDTLYKNQWHLKSKNGIEQIAGADVNAPLAWDTTKGSRKIVVAVVDDGFDLSHPDFKGNGKVVHAKDFADGDLHPFPEASNNDYHGTPCAGVAIGEENGSGIVGIAPKCSFMPIRFDLAADDDLLFELFDYTGARADVISCSWGPVPVYAPLSSLLKNKFTQLAKNGGPRKKGVVICFAAHNFNAPIKDPNNTGFRWRHPSAGIVNTPGYILNGNAAHPDVIAVSASTSQNRKAAYSNWGKEISVCAPSSNWHPLDPSAKVPGRGIWTTDNENFGLGFTSNSRYTGNFGGTSSATPLVAGTAALVLSANPKLTAKQVKEILQDTADKIIDEQPDPVLNFRKGTYGSDRHSEWFGYGKINAAKAVKKAKAMGQKKPPKENKEDQNTTSEIPEGLIIASALVNVKGPERGNEKVSLLNTSDKNIALKGWRIVTGRNKEKTFKSEKIGAGAYLTVKLPPGVTLNNRGGTIRLLAPNGKEMHKVKYTSRDAKKDGWTVSF
ncbi:MAG: S8 family serine peptidase [Bacteroidota bacterium]